MKHYSEIISIDPEILFGKPIVRNTMRITIPGVLGWLASGMSHADILNDYPDITTEDINACLAYAADREHKLRIPS
jgi:uncharacterized protein (DUF433 family)